MNTFLFLKWVVLCPDRFGLLIVMVVVVVSLAIFLGILILNFMRYYNVICAQFPTINLSDEKPAFSKYQPVVRFRTFFFSIRVSVAAVTAYMYVKCCEQYLELKILYVVCG